MRFFSRSRRLMATLGLVSLCFLASFAETDLAKNKPEDSSEATLSETLTADKSAFVNDSLDGKESSEATLSVGQPAYQTATAVSNATVASVKNLSSNRTLTLNAAGNGNGTVLAIGLTDANSPSSRPKNQSNIHSPLGLALTNVGGKRTTQKSTPNAHSKKSPSPKETSKKRHKGSTRERRNGHSSSTTEGKLLTSLILVHCSHWGRLLFLALSYRQRVASQHPRSCICNHLSYLLVLLLAEQYPDQQGDCSARQCF